MLAVNLNSSKSNAYRQSGGSGNDKLTVKNASASRVTITQDGGPGNDVLLATNLNSSKSNVTRVGGPGKDKCPGGGRRRSC